MFFGSFWGADFKNKKFQVEKLHISSKKGSFSRPIGIREGQKIYVCKTWQYGYQFKGLGVYSHNMFLAVSYRTPGGQNGNIDHYYSVSVNFL